MTTEQLLNLKYESEAGKQKLQKALRKIKPFAKDPVDEQIPMEKLEKVVYLYLTTYEVTMQWISFALFDGNSKPTYQASFKRADDHSWLGNVYGQTAYELWIKMAIKLFSDIKHLEIPRRESK